jgi:hypothetical protein
MKTTNELAGLIDLERKLRDERDKIIAQIGKTRMRISEILNPPEPKEKK